MAKAGKTKLFSKRRVLLIIGGLFLALIGWALTFGPASRLTAKLISLNPFVPAAEKAGRDLASNHCSGTGPRQLSHTPMDNADFGALIPYGLMIDGHVTPIDHQYFEPTNRDLGADAYPVYAAGDADLVNYEFRQAPGHPPSIRLVFSQSCTFLYYYDLLTSLSPRLQKAVKNQHFGLDLPVKAGEEIGRIGAQTLDFAVWNTQKPLKSFIVPEHYSSERWKIYTADPLDYYSGSVKKMMLSHYIRTAKPISGRIDYDIEGRLVGNWFQEGTTDYEGGPNEDTPTYWKGHLAIAPDHIDPSVFVISIGDFQGKARQFGTVQNMPRPSKVSMGSGLVKYDLAQFGYNLANGQPWKYGTVARPLKARVNGQQYGCMLFQLLGLRQLKVEAFPDKQCLSIDTFSRKAKLYYR